MQRFHWCDLDDRDITADMEAALGVKLSQAAYIFIMLVRSPEFEKILISLLE